MKNSTITHLIAGCFGFAVVLAAIGTLYRGIWEGHLSTGQATNIINLDSSPVWSPPAKPTYRDFASVFEESLPRNQPLGSTIRVVLKFEWMLFEFFLWFWAICLGTSLWSLLPPAERRHFVLHHVRWVSVGFTGAVVLCMMLWIVGGGWGAPFPLFFALLGLIVGLGLGNVRWHKSRGA